MKKLIYDYEIDKEYNKFYLVVEDNNVKKLFVFQLKYINRGMIDDLHNGALYHFIDKYKEKLKYNMYKLQLEAQKVKMQYKDCKELKRLLDESEEI